MRSLTLGQIKRLEFDRMGVLGPPSKAELKNRLSGKDPDSKTPENLENKKSHFSMKKWEVGRNQPNVRLQSSKPDQKDSQSQRGYVRKCWA